MMIRRLALAALVALFPAVASAQFAIIGPTQPTSDNGDRLATTAWVNNFFAVGMPLASGKIFIGSVGNIATPQTPSGDWTISNAGLATLATVNANVGTFGSATACITTTQNAKGLTTAISAATCTPAIGSITGLGTGIAAALAVNTGSAGAPVLFNGAGGTPSSLTLTSATGLPVSTGVSGFGTGVATALGVNVGTAGAPVVNGGALGTPSSGTLTNATGLPTTGLTGTLQAAQEPAHTGDMTNSAGSLATTVLKTNGVSFTAAATAANGQLPGTATNDNASAGNVGEYVSSIIVPGSAVALTTSVAKDITTISLTAGDWDVAGVCVTNPAGTTTTSLAQCGISLTLNTQPSFPADNSGVGFNQIALGAGLSESLTMEPARLSLNATTTIHLVATANFAVSTMSVYGKIRARRVR